MLRCCFPLVVVRAWLACVACVVPVTWGATGTAAGPALNLSVADPDERGPRYARLQKALRDYTQIAERGGWPSLPDGPTLKSGMTHPQVNLLRQRLAATNDLKERDAPSLSFDTALEAAVRRFQQRHGLLVDGIVGSRTREALNVPVQARVGQLRLNLERRSRISPDLGSHYLFVNMADFLLKVVKEDRTVLTMRIVVGAPHRQTPLFSANLAYIDFNPFWNIPDSIAREEILPRVRENTGYFAGQSIRVFGKGDAQTSELAADRIDWQGVAETSFPYRLRQDPGPLNPLGRVKFMFPNSFDVYLHDTPAQHLFDATVRTFSHGCIRVEKPVDLAAHLLPRLSREEVQRIMDSGKRSIMHLPAPVPVHLTYLTAWVNKDGSVHFRRDVYGRDRLSGRESW